jgi:hypothetical protein
MFKTAPTTEPTHKVMVPANLIPISHLALDLPEPPVGGWVAYLSGRGLEVLTDDIGRPAVSRADARQLFDEQREEEARRREVRERQEQAAVEADRVRRASVWGGLPASAIPEGVSAASAMFAADRDARPRRQSPLQHALDQRGRYCLPPHPGRRGPVMTAMRSTASAIAATPIPSPMVVDATVFHEPGTRTLAVRLSEREESGYAAHLWREAFLALRKAEESERPPRTVWASGGGGDQIAFATCGDYQMLTFHFPVGSGAAYAALVGRPGLSAFVAIDREALYFISVRFRHRP